MNKEISFKMSKETQKVLEKLLKVGGIRHYAMQLEDGTLLDLVEYGNYKILEQALNEIKKIINECKMLMPHEFDWEEQTEGILQIINEALDRLFNNCEEIDNHNFEEDKTGYKMLEDIKLIQNLVDKLDKQNQQKDNAIDECIEWVKNNLSYSYDSDESSFLDHEDVYKLLDKLEQAKGKNKEV